MFSILEVDFSMLNLAVAFCLLSCAWRCPKGCVDNFHLMKIGKDVPANTTLPHERPHFYLLSRGLPSYLKDIWGVVLSVPAVASAGGLLALLGPSHTKIHKSGESNISRSQLSQDRYDSPSRHSA